VRAVGVSRISLKCTLILQGLSNFVMAVLNNSMPESFSQVYKIKLESSAHVDEEIRMMSNSRKAFVDVAEILALK
jgi:hypothetical protein